LRFLLQPERPQPVHVLDRGVVPGVLLAQRDGDLRLPALVFLKCGFGDFAGFGAHQILPVRDMKRTPEAA
jgi:hypothetical protein